MANFIISPYAISFNSIKNALQNYINDKNVSSVLDTWSDFYTAGAGQTIIELDAAVASFYAFHFLIGRREAYLPVAQNYNSIIGGAASLGYSASRGHNVKVAVKIIPNTTKTLNKWDIVGSFAEYDIVLMETVTIKKDEEVTLKGVIGNSTAQSITITSPEVQQFTFTANDTTDDVRLILTDREVPYTTELKDAMDDKYILLTNPYGSVDIFYLNQSGNHVSYGVKRGSEYGWTYASGVEGATVDSTANIYKDIIQSSAINNDGSFVYTGTTYTSNYSYATQDVLYLQYIQRNTLKYSSVSASNISIDDGDVVDVSLIEDFKDVQSKESVRLAASVYHETNNVVRARKDFSKILLQNNTLNLIDANDKDINPGLMAVTYLREDGSLLTTAEKERYMESVTKVSPDSVPNIFIEDPVPVVRTLAISFWQKTGETLPANVDEYIQNIVDSYKNKLAPLLDLEAIENELEKIPGVKVARVDFGSQEYNVNTKYKLYDIVEVPDILVGDEYQTWNMLNIKVQTKSGEDTPDWGSASEYGEEVIDSNLVWEKSNKYISSIPYRWKQKGDFNMYSDIAVGYNIYPNCTSNTEPTWDRTNVVDGNVTFNKVKTYDYVLPEWEEHHPYLEDSYVLIKNNKHHAVYKVTGLLSKSSASEPDWAVEEIDDTIQDNAIRWNYKFDEFVAGNSYLTNKSVIQVIDGKMYHYKSCKANDSTTVYWWGTDDYKKATEKNPLDGREQVYEMKTETYREWEVIEHHEHGADEYGFVTHTRNVQGDLVWELVEIFDNLIEWQASTELGLDKYILKNGKFFLSTDISTSLTGENWFNSLEDFPETMEDNNVVWEKDTFNLLEEVYESDGTTWYGDTEYVVFPDEDVINDLIIVDNGEYSYIYIVTYVNNELITSNNVIFTVKNYTGTTADSDHTPQWTYTKTLNGEEVTYSYNNVVDNDILWTKTTNTSTKVWTPNTRMTKGDIISTDGGYYTFSSIMGTSGKYNKKKGIYEPPNWNGINGGVVIDNNITWQKLEKTTKVQLDWKEYLELDYSIEEIY